MNDENDGYGPETEVWNHLYSGLDLADMEFNQLDAESRASVDEFGAKIHQARKQFALQRDQRVWAEIYEIMLQDAWYRHAAELEFARECIDRASDALERFVSLRPVLTDYSLGEKPASYLRETIDTYLFGFDAAAIALAGAFIEQLLRELVVAKSVYTEARLRRERPSGLSLLENAHRASVIEQSYDAAKRVLDQRNAIMHRHVWEKKIIKGVAQRCIADLSAVLVEVGRME